MRLHQVLTDDVCRRLGIFVIPPDFRLSVVIPVFNEVNTVLQVIERVRRNRLPLEIILVDDGSMMARARNWPAFRRRRHQDHSA